MRGWTIPSGVETRAINKPQRRPSEYARSTGLKQKIIVVFLAVLAFAIPGLTQQKKGSADPAATLKALEEKWAASQVKGDTAAMEALLADTFVYTDIEGGVKDKAGMIREIKAGTLKIEAAKVEDLKVMVYGDAAVVTGRWVGKGIENGKPFEDTERWTDTWVLQKGRWRCVASQSTLVK